AGTADRHGSWNRISNIGVQSIQLVPLTDLLDERGVTKVDLWKLDVEGLRFPHWKAPRNGSPAIRSAPFILSYEAKMGALLGNISSRSDTFVIFLIGEVNCISQLSYRTIPTVFSSHTDRVI